jgi:hypothetical protein
MKIPIITIAPRRPAPGHRTYLNRPGLTQRLTRVDTEHLKRIREARAARGLDEGISYVG